jgi:hypothetical protein
MAAEKVVLSFWRRLEKKEKHDFTDGDAYYYRGNKIAWFDSEDLWVSDAGWKTNTTKERLSKIGCILKQLKGEWFLKGKNWDGSPVNYTKW